MDTCKYFLLVRLENYKRWNSKSARAIKLQSEQQNAHYSIFRFNLDLFKKILGERLRLRFLELGF